MQADGHREHFWVPAVTSPELEMPGSRMKVLSEMDIQWMQDLTSQSSLKFTLAIPFQ